MLAVGSGITSMEEGEDWGQVWEQRRQPQRILQGVRQGRRGGTGEPALPCDKCRVELVYILIQQQFPSCTARGSSGEDVTLCLLSVRCEKMHGNIILSVFSLQGEGDWPTVEKMEGHACSLFIFT